jgi:hypothetical protein
MARFGEAPGEDCLPELASQVEQAGLGIVGDAIEDAFRRVNHSPLLGAHRLPEHAEVGDAVDAFVFGIDPHDTFKSSLNDQKKPRSWRANEQASPRAGQRSVNRQGAGVAISR